MTLTNAAWQIRSAARSLDSYKNRRPRRIVYPDGSSITADPLALLEGIAAMLMAREQPQMETRLIRAWERGKT